MNCVPAIELSELGATDPNAVEIVGRHESDGLPVGVKICTGPTPRLEKRASPLGNIRKHPTNDGMPLAPIGGEIGFKVLSVPKL